ncbi:hypothetical protein [Ciceribacter selenitireducens]|uniref:hypothetical protein n=1 Tax=Ciceribacter selenitireducens TaxID=448181 RepID=UPI0011B06C83|nr:hypothetical protein [Ciceribacter selenitireducens]
MKKFNALALASVFVTALMATTLEARADAYVLPVTAPYISLTNTVYTKSWGTLGLPTSGHLIVSGSFNIKYTTPTYGTLQVRVCQDLPTTDKCTPWATSVTGNLSLFVGNDASYPFYMQSKAVYSTNRSTNANAGGQNSMLSVNYD